MHHIDLNIITSEHIWGKWWVNKKYVSNEDYGNIFFHIHYLEIMPDGFKAVNGEMVEGSVSVFREKEIIYNPQIAFFVNELKVANAIITKLFIMEENDITINSLTLYFTTGLELTLFKN